MNRFALVLATLCLWCSSATAQTVVYTQPSTTSTVLPTIYGAPKLTFTWSGPGRPTFSGLTPVYVTNGGTVQLTVTPATVTVTVPAGIASLRITCPGTCTTPPVVPAASFNAAAGTGWTVVENLDFGTSSTSTVKTSADLVNKLEFHDQFGTIANGSNYGTMIVAEPTAPDFFISQHATPSGDGKQPKASGFREFTADSLLCHVKQLNLAHDADKTTLGPSWMLDGGNGSFMLKFGYPNGGSRLGKSIIAETRFRVKNAAPVDGYWLAPIWIAGSYWDKGPEIDPLETFSGWPVGAPNAQPGEHLARTWHSNSVGGVDAYPYSSWPVDMARTGLTAQQMWLTDYHTLTLVYRKDNTYTVYFDGRVAQSGTLQWANPGTTSPITLRFLYDVSWGHKFVGPVANITTPIPADGKVLTYEIDYVRIGEKL